jgi:hypothetical protein
MMNCPGYHKRGREQQLSAMDDTPDRLHMCGIHGQPFDTLRDRASASLHGFLNFLERLVAGAEDVAEGNFIYKLADHFVHLERQNTLLQSMSLEQYLVYNPSALEQAKTILKLHTEGRIELPGQGAIESVEAVGIKAKRARKPASKKRSAKR